MLISCAELICAFVFAYTNIAKSEQSSHTSGGSDQRPYHFNSLERKKNAQIKGLISNMWLNFLYTVQLVISDVCTNFQNSRSSSSWEIFDKNFHINYIGVRDRKREK